MSLTSEEQETLINYDYFDKIVHIFTTLEHVKRRFESRIGARPGVIYGGSPGAWTIDIPMEYCRKPDLVIQPNRAPMTAERKAQLDEKLAPYRFVKKTTAA